MEYLKADDSNFETRLVELETQGVEYSRKLNNLEVFYKALDVSRLVIKAELAPEVIININDAYRQGSKNIFSPIVDLMINLQLSGYGFDKSLRNIKAWHLETGNSHSAETEASKNDIYQRRLMPSNWGLLLISNGDLIRHVSYNQRQHTDYQVLNESNISNPDHVSRLLDKFVVEKIPSHTTQTI